MEGKRFEITETEGSVKGFYVVVDRETALITLSQSLERAGVFAH